MGRIIYPDNFLLSRDLFVKVKAKDTLDGAASVIRPFMTEEAIVLATDNTAGTNADAEELLRNTKNKTAEIEREHRDHLWDPIDKRWQGEIQFLKKLFKSNPNKLGDWTIPLAANKINLPKEFINRTTIYTTFVAKHNTYAAGTSPLEPYLTENAINLTTDLANTSLAKVAHGNFIAAAMDAEQATAQRDVLWNPVRNHLIGIGAFLMGLFSTNQKKCGSWGYEVDDSKRKPITRTTKLIPGQKKTVGGIQLGSSVKNLGTCAIHIYQGTNTAGIPIIIAPNNEFGVMKGYSKITVMNPDALKTAVFVCIVSR